MDKLYPSKIALVETVWQSGGNGGKKIFGICVDGDKFHYENKTISTNKVRVGELISKIADNDVANIHISDVVCDFIFEYGLEI